MKKNIKGVIALLIVIGGAFVFFKGFGFIVDHQKDLPGLYRCLALIGYITSICLFIIGWNYKKYKIFKSVD